MIPKTVKSFILKSSIIMLLAGLLASCSMLEREEGARVSYKLDSKTIEKIRETAESESYSRRGRGVDTDSSTFLMEVSVHGDYNKTLTSTISTETEVAFDGIPVGSNIYVEASIYTQTDGERVNLYKGKSKTFTVRSGENQVVFVLRRVTGDEESGGGNGSGGGGNNSGSSEPEITNTFPDGINFIFVANGESGGDSSNDGTEEHPLDSIEHAVEKIHDLIEDNTNSYGTGEDWAIILLSDLHGPQKVPGTVSGQEMDYRYILKLYIASQSVDNIRTIDGGFSNTDPTGTNDGTTLTIEPFNYTYLQCVNITGGWAVLGGGVKTSARKLYINSGAKIYGNKAVDRGAGILAYPTNGQGQVVLQGGIIGGDGDQGNVCTGNGSTYGYGGGVAVMGGGAEGVSSTSMMEFIMTSGSLKGNKAYKGAGVYLTGRSGVGIEGGSVTNNTTADYTGGEGGAIYSENIVAGSVKVSGGSISSNTATSGQGAGLYFNTENVAKNFYMQGNGSFGENDYVCFPDTSISPIQLIGMLNGPAHVATIQLAHYTQGTVIIQDKIKPDHSLSVSSSIFSRFTVLPDSNNKEYYIRAVAPADPNDGCSGLLTKVVDPAELTYYVSPNGNDSNSGRGTSSDAALLTINGAIQKIQTQQASDPNIEYFIKVVGTLTSKQVVGGATAASFSPQVDKITIEGYNGLSSGIPQDGIDVTGATVPSTPVLIASFDNTLGQLSIKNLKITGGNGGGLNVGGYMSSPICNVVLDEGTLITGNNSTNPGAGVAVVSGCTLTVLDGAKITGNRTSGNGGGVMLNANTTLNMYGGEISGNVAGDNGGSGVGSGVYVGGSNADGDSSVVFQGNALINSNNDVYLRDVSHSYIYIESLLYEDLVAKITPNTYHAGDQLIYTRAPSGSGAFAIYPDVSDVYDKFAITDKADGSTWALNEDGELYKVSGGTTGPVTYYVAPSSGGGSSSGDGSVDRPFDTISAAHEACETYCRANATPNTFVIKVDGILTEGQSIYGSNSLNNHTIASVTIEGKNGLSGGVPQDGIVVPAGAYDQTALNINGYVMTLNQIIIKNFKLTSEKGTGLELGGDWSDEDSSLICNVILDEGALITGCNSGRGASVIGRSRLNMKAGSKITGNANSGGNGGGVYLEGGTTLDMQGGEISSNTADYGSGVYVSNNGEFIINNSALVASTNDVYLASGGMVSIGGPLTVPGGATYMAVITPQSYTPNTPVLGLAVDHYDENNGYNPVYIDTTTIGNEHAKFAVTPTTKIVGSQIVDVNYIVDEYGTLQEDFSGGGGTSGIVVTSNAGGSGIATMLPSNEPVEIAISNNDETIDFTKLKIKVGSTEYVLDSLRNFVTTGSTDNENSYEFSFGSSLTGTGTEIIIYYDENEIKRLTVMRAGNMG